MKVSIPAALVDAVLVDVPFYELYPDYGRPAVTATVAAAKSRLVSAMAATLSPGDVVHFGLADLLDEVKAACDVWDPRRAADNTPERLAVKELNLRDRFEDSRGL